MVNKPKVSVIIPVYNGEKYIANAIRSVLNQTYENIEILVIDDGSNDRTKEIVYRFGDSVKYYFKKNGGVSSALNYGIRQMSGDFFSWLSHDDEYKPKKIENQINYVLSRKINDDFIIYGSFEYISSTGIKIDQIDILTEYPFESHSNSLFPIFFGLANGCTMLIPKQNFIKYGLFNEKLKSTQDYDMWFRMFREVDVIFLNTSDVRMRVHASQGSKVLTSHTKENNELWKKMISQITVSEMVNICGNPLLFLNRLRLHLYKSGLIDIEIISCLDNKENEVNEIISNYLSTPDSKLRLLALSWKNTLNYCTTKYLGGFHSRFKIYCAFLELKNHGILSTFRKMVLWIFQKGRKK